jgi:hypothetical protein
VPGRSVAEGACERAAEEALTGTVIGLTAHPPRCWLPGMGRAVILAAAVALSLALPAGAWACNNPRGQSDGGQPAGGTGAGEPVYFVIGNVDDGATWTISWEGASEPISGEVQGSGSRYRGSFAMPGFGTRNRSVSFDVQVVHEGHEDGPGPWGSSFEVQYRGVSAPPSSSPQSTSPQPADQRPAPETQPVPGDVKAPTGTQPIGGGGTFPAGGTGGGSPSGPAGPDGGPGTPSASIDPLGGPAGSAAADPAFATHESSPARPGRVAEPVARAALSERAAEGARVPTVRAIATPRSQEPDGSGRLILVLFALMAAGVGAAMATRRRRGGSGRAAVAEVPLVPSDPAVEAELQEIIAEERARLERGREERPPAEVAAARDDPG